MKIVLTALAAALTASAASAASFSGTFVNDDQKAGFRFYVTAPNTVVTMTSTGYAAGGFDPVLSFYDPAGLELDQNDDQAFGNSDSQLVETLGVGRYTVYLTQYDNFGPASLDLPFNFEGQHNFRGGFQDFFGNQRTGFWSLDITGATGVAAVPEASTWAMLIAGFGVVGAASRRRRTGVVAA